MADIYSKKKRSEIMSRIRSKNTSIERMVFHYLRANKIYFQKHYGRVPGNPDIALPRKKRAIFLDGDFWHGRNFKVAKLRLPNSYWRDKIQGNILRDLKKRRMLKNQGWETLRIWEGDLERKTEMVLHDIALFLTT